jgi:hypothetical protein
MTSNHDTYIISIVIIIVIFVIILFGSCAISTEGFTNLKSFNNVFKNINGKKVKFANPAYKKIPDEASVMAKRVNSKFIDTSVPNNLGFSDISEYYNSMGDTLKGTSLINISAVDSARYPIMIETPMNWYNSQPLILPNQHLGTNQGKYDNCICNQQNQLTFPNAGPRPIKTGTY